MEGRVAFQKLARSAARTLTLAGEAQDAEDAGKRLGEAVERRAVLAEDVAVEHELVAELGVDAAAPGAGVAEEPRARGLGRARRGEVGRLAGRLRVGDRREHVVGTVGDGVLKGVFELVRSQSQLVVGEQHTISGLVMPMRSATKASLKPLGRGPSPSSL